MRSMKYPRHTAKMPLPKAILIAFLHVTVKELNSYVGQATKSAGWMPWH